MKTVKNFIWYMYNRWNEYEASRIFGKDLGNHIFNKWVEYRENVRDYTVEWFMALDKECQTKIIERANEIYGG